jgi:micrococcal nuclease
MEENYQALPKSSFGLKIFSFLLLSISLILVWSAGNLQSSPQSSPVAQEQTNEVTPLASGSAALGLEGQETTVKRVVDGDTIEIEDGQKVRYIGIDTPETVDPRRPVDCFGKEASNENKKLVEGKKVILVKDVSETDKYGRLLRLVYLSRPEGNLFINDYLVRQGFAKVVTYPPDVKYAEEFKKAEEEARNNNRGLWQKCSL